MWPQFLWVHLCISLVDVEGFACSVSYIPSGSCPLSAPSSTGFSEKRDLMETSCLWLSDRRSPTLCSLSGCGLGVSSHRQQDEGRARPWSASLVGVLLCSSLSPSWILANGLASLPWVVGVFHAFSKALMPLAAWLLADLHRKRHGFLLFSSQTPFSWQRPRLSLLALLFYT